MSGVFFISALAHGAEKRVHLDGFDLSCPASVNEGGTAACTLTNSGTEAKNWPVVGILHLSSDANRALVRGSPVDLQLATPDPSSEIDGGLWWIGSVLIAYSRFDWEGEASTQASRTVSITIQDDDDYEGEEVFYVSLTASGSRGVGFLYTNRQAITISASDSKSSDAQLQELAIMTDAGEVPLDFSSDTTSYTATVAYEVTEAVVTPVANHKGAAIAVDGEPVESGAGSPAIPLSAGNTAIEVAVTAEGATTKTYGITVTRQTKTENVEVEADGFTLSCPSSVNEGAAISCTLTNTQVPAAEWPVVAIVHSSADGDARALIEEDPLIPKSSPAFGVDLRLSETQNPARENYNHGYGELFSGGSTSVYTTYGYQKFDWSGQGAPNATRSVVIQTMADDEVESAEIFYVAVAPSGYTGLSRLVDNKAPIFVERGDTPDTTPPTVNKIAIGSDPGSDLIYAPDDEIQATVTFSETVEVEGTPQLTLRVGGGDRTADYQGGTGTDALVFVYEVAEGDEDTDGVSIDANSLSLNGGTIKDASDNSAVLDHEALSPQSSHKVDSVRPGLAATDGVVVNGTTLTLTYDEPLDGSSTPASGDFTVSGGDQARTVSRVSVTGSTVELTLDVGAGHGEAGIQVSYTPGANPIRDVPGNDTEALSREPVANETPDTTSPEVSSLAIGSDPGSDETYAAGDEIELTVTFDETVVVTGTPQMRLRVGSRTRMAGYLRGTDTAALVFGYEVAVGDEDTGGVSIEAGRIALNGGTIEDAADNDAVLDHEVLAAQAGHKVDGVRPAFVSAAVDGASMTLTYGEALDEGSRPATGDFTVQVDGSGRSVSGVSVSGSVVILTLNPAVEHGDTGIRVSYTPDTNPIRDAVGNEAVALSSRPVINTTETPNTAPRITSVGPFTVLENQASVGRLTARDGDPGDTVTNWETVGGADRFQFSIASDTGVLSFRTAPDYESPVDATSTDPVSGAGDNEYVVTVRVTSGAGGRELEVEQTLTVRVTDGREPPKVPRGPDRLGGDGREYNGQLERTGKHGPGDHRLRRAVPGKRHGALHRRSTRGAGALSDA